jgi:membrane fusion protein YbhG
MKPKIIAIVLAVALAFAMGWWWLGRSGQGSEFVLTGNVEVRQVNLGFKVGGRIAKLKVDEGDTVAPGQPLAELEKVYFRDTITQLTASRDQAKANLAKLQAGNRPEEIAQAEAAVHERKALAKNAEIAMARAQMLHDKSVGTQKALDDAQAAYRETEARLNSAMQALRLMKAGARAEDIAAAKAQLAEREAALQVAQRQLADAVLTAPSKGVVLSRVHEPGAIVAPGETVFVLSLTDPVWVRSYVSEPELGRVRPGMEVKVTTDTPGTGALTGRVGFISSTAEFTPKTVETRELRTSLVYRIRIVVSDGANRLRQGMPVTITIASPKPSP